MIRPLEVEYAESAKADLEGILRYIVENGGAVETALRIVMRIEARCQRIGNVPRGGRRRDDLVPGLRTVPFERSAVIACVVDHDAVRIMNVFYGGRDFEALLRSAPKR